VLAFESDPEQLWHSRWAEGSSSNRAGLADPKVDALIEAIGVELDDARRAELFHRLQAEVYARQPYLFRVSAPHRFALARRVRNVELFALDPGYSIRRWYVEPERD
jgi:ABC-type transport system substrate-binding protein